MEETIPRRMIGQAMELSERISIRSRVPVMDLEEEVIEEDIITSEKALNHHQKEGNVTRVGSQDIWHVSVLTLDQSGRFTIHKLDVSRVEKLGISLPFFLRE